MTALKDSAYLIVICSPAAARSKWVNEEVLQFRAAHGAERILAVIVAGEPFASADGRPDDECFPEALRSSVDGVGALAGRQVEPAAADLRPGRDGWRHALLKLLSAMLGVGLDHLVQRHHRRRQRQLVGVAGVAVALSAAMAALALTAVSERNEAYAQRAQAEGLIEFMIGDLRKKLEPSARLDVLDAVGAKALAYYASEEPRGLDDDSLGRRARVLHLLGDLRNQRGDLSGALQDFEQASRVTAELLAKQPNDGTRIFNHAQSVYYVGLIADRRGRTAEAEQAFLSYKRLADQLVALDPKRDDWRAEVVYANENLGTLWVHEGHTAKAEAAFTVALAADQLLAAKAPDDRDRQTDLAGVYAWRADSLFAQGKTDGARRDRLSERAIFDRLLAQRPNDNAVKQQMIQNARALADIDNQAGRPADAVKELTQAATQAEGLMAFQPEDTQTRFYAATTYLFLARAELASGEAAAAGAESARALDLAEGLVRKDPTVTLWRGYLLGGARLGAIRIAATRAGTARALQAALLPAIAESDRLASLVDPKSADVQLARVTADALVLAADAEALSGKDDLARASWSRAAGLCLCDTLEPGGPRGSGRAIAEPLARSRLRLAAAVRGRGGVAELSLAKRQWLSPYLW
jgi:tetratricopeptide (TPR) repeat protein